MAKEKHERERTKTKRLEHKLRVVEKRDKMLIKDFSAERAVMKEVSDHFTLQAVMCAHSQIASA